MLPRMSWDVPDIDVSQSLLPCYSAVFFESFHRRAGEVHELVVRMESEEVNRYVRPEVVVEPPTQLPRLVEIVADLWDDQVCDLDVCLTPVLDLLYRLENWLCVRYSDVFSDKVRLCASFEIDRYAVKKVVHHRHCVGCIESIGDEDVDEPVL